MVDTALSALTEVTALADTDEMYVNDGGASKKVTVANAAKALRADVTAAMAGTLSGSYFGPNVASLTDFNGVADRAYYVPFTPAADCSIDTIAINVKTAAASSTVRLGIYQAGSNSMPDALVDDFGTVDSSTTGEKTITISPAQDLVGGVLYWLTAVPQGGAPVLRGFNGSYSVIPESSVPSTSLNSSIRSDLSAVPGALPATALVLNAQIAGPNVYVRMV